MKKIASVALGLLALGIAPAFAADLPAQVYTKAPMPVDSPFYNWSGFYIGLNGGGASSHKCWDLTSVAGIAVPATSEGCHDATGGMVGGQFGYRWQMHSWVFGVEAQGDWADLKGSNTSLLVPAVSNQTKINGLGLVTGQVGYAWNNVLWYVKGGAAVTGDNYNGVVGGIVLDTASQTRWGGAVGTGLEIGFGSWSVAFEYDHLFMGSSTATFTFAGTGIIDRTDNIKQNVDMGTVRINYTFGGPVYSKY